MVTSITNAIQTDPRANAIQTPPVPKAVTADSKGAQPLPQPPIRPNTDTVQISSAALALQEAIETPTQTAKEASAGDHQAQRLLAKEAATRKTE